jgi:Flp pilus assembly protein TadD
MTLEFSAPRQLHNRNAGDNGAALRRIELRHSPPAIGQAIKTQGTNDWLNRAAMYAKADAFQLAYNDYRQTVTVNPNDPIALEGIVRAAKITQQASEALANLRVDDRPKSAEWFVARSKLQAVTGAHDDAIASARQAASKSPLGLEQLASLFADSGDTVQLDSTVAELRTAAPNAAATEYYAAVAKFLHGDANEAAHLAERAIGIDPNYTASYDLVGAAYTKLGRVEAARHAFERSLSFDAHDSTAYENLGVLELNAGHRAAARNYFAEALWLVPDSQTARQGLAQSRALRP